MNVTYAWWSELKWNTVHEEKMEVYKKSPRRLRFTKPVLGMHHFWRREGDSPKCFSPQEKKIPVCIVNYLSRSRQFNVAEPVVQEWIYSVWKQGFQGTWNIFCKLPQSVFFPPANRCWQPQCFFFPLIPIVSPHSQICYC